MDFGGWGHPPIEKKPAGMSKLISLQQPGSLPPTGQPSGDPSGTKAMKNIKMRLLTALFFISIQIVSAQSAHWEWVHSFGGPQGESGRQLLLHPNGYLYCTGGFQEGWVGVQDTFFIEGYAQDNGFLAKYNTDGQVQQISVGTSLPNSPPQPGGFPVFSGVQLSTNASDMVMSLGIYGTAVVDSQQFTGSLLNGTNTLAKWGEGLSLKEVKYFMGGNGSPRMETPIACGSHLYTVGRYSKKFMFMDTCVLYNPDSLSMVGTQKAFFAKMDTNGSCKFLKQVLGGRFTTLRPIAVDGDKIFLSGSSDSCFVYDTINYCKGSNAFAACLFQTDTNGAVVWAKPIRSASNIGSLGFGGIYPHETGFLLNGFIEADLYIGTDTIPYTDTLTGSFIAKLDSIGNLIWYKKFYGTSVNVHRFAKNKTDGSFYTKNKFSGQIVLCGDTITAQSSGDLSIARFNDNGDCLGYKILRNANDGEMVTDSVGNVYITGSIGTDGNTYFDEITISQSGMGDFFIAKLSPIVSGVSSKTVEDGKLNIYANPNAGLFTVEVPQELKSNEARLIIYGPLGELVKDEPTDISNSRVSVNLGEVVRGIYTVVLQSNQRRFTGRVVVE